MMYMEDQRWQRGLSCMPSWGRCPFMSHILVLEDTSRAAVWRQTVTCGLWCCLADNEITFQYLSELLCPFHEIIRVTCY